MDPYENLSQYSKEELIKLIEIYSKNRLAMDGVWFQLTHAAANGVSHYRTAAPRQADRFIRIR